MRNLPYSLLISLLSLFLIFSACEKEAPPTPEPDPQPEPVIKTYYGNVTHIFNHTKRYPDGSDSTISRTETATDSFSIKETDVLTYEIVFFKTGCDLTFHGVPGPCPGYEFSLTEDLFTYWGWDYDYENEINIQFSTDTTQVDINYTYSDGYYTEVYDNDGFTVLYEEIRTEEYHFQGKQ